ncbi:hypothetical protein B0H17DRAFT_1332300 [Mycena rosella]|uniref:F-box domain-containing protein n=1 Tax=Mycena rosella TaxID=1033263 RepID=A0AAD7DEV9_MYCRO|nr:hypothetical protein B0H17DRAFT_1332300 [Mycena rosella]
MPRAQLPCELCDFIVDYLHADRAALGCCALVCRAWVPASRFHLFERVSLSKKDGYAAARLDVLLASPQATFARAVRRLDLHNALAPIQIRAPRTGRLHVKTLLALVPRIAQLQDINILALSDLPFDLLPAFPKVHTLYLADLSAGPALLRLANYLPNLAHLTLKRVHAIPYRAPVSPTLKMEKLRSLTVRGSSIAFLGWLAALGPNICTLDLGDLPPSEVRYLTKYLEALARPLERLKVGLSPGTDVHEFAWDELAPFLDKDTRLVVCVEMEERDEDEDSEDSEDDRTEFTLRAQFPELEKRGMLDVRISRVWAFGG